MPDTVEVDPPDPRAESPAAARARARFALVSLFAAGYTYLLIVFGGIVRISGSGLGCGDDWPRCNGQWIPIFDVETFIEWFHRLLAAGLSIPFVAMLLVALAFRRSPGFRGRGGLLRPAGLVVVMLVVQALLGALTVKLELESPSVTVMHFGLASLLLAVLLVAALRAGAFGGAAAQGGAASAAEVTRPVGVAPADGPASASARRRFARMAASAAVLGFVVLVMGAFTANAGKAPGVAGAGPAAWACGVVEGSFFRSFPLCNGELLPSGGGLAHIQMTHRVLAILLALHVLGGVIVAWSRGAPRAVRFAATAAFALIAAQLAVAAALILMYLPLALQALHLIVGVAVWAVLVVWAGIAGRDARDPWTAASAPATGHAASAARG